MVPAPRKRSSTGTSDPVPEFVSIDDVSEIASQAPSEDGDAPRPIFRKRAPRLPGQPGSDEPADLVKMAELSIHDLVGLLRRYGLDVHEGIDRARLLVAFMRGADRLELDIVGEGQAELLPDGYGFLRSARNTFLHSPDDLYLAPTMVTELGIRPGMNVRGTIKRGRRKDKYFAVDEVLTINGRPPAEAKTWKPFEELEAVFPDKRCLLETQNRYDYSCRIVDLVAPIGFGQRALIVSPPRAGKTMMLKSIANAITTNYPKVRLLVFLVDERPEEVTDMQRSVEGEVIASTFDEPPQRHVAVAERVEERARSLVESGYDVVLLIDSITRLGRAFNAAAQTTGRILSGGLEAKALQKPRRLFGSARNIDGGGSLTILATALVDTNSRMDEVIFEEFKGTGNMEIVLSRAISEQRIFPAIDVHKSGTRMEDLLYDPMEAELVKLLRSALADLPVVGAIEELLMRLRKTASNPEFLLSLRAARF